VADARVGIAFATNAQTGANWDGAAIQGANNGVDGKAHILFGEVGNNTFTENVRFTTDGRVGIGTNAPGYLLHVNGTFKASGVAEFAQNINFSSSAKYITFYGNDSGDHAIGSRDGSGNSADDLRINTYGALYINLDSNGNNSSTADFHIARHGSTGAISASDYLLMLSGETGQLQLKKYGSGSHTGTSAYKLSVDSSGNIIETSIGSGAVDGAGTANYISKWTDGDTIGNSTIYDDGDVGINQVSPTAKLHVRATSGNSWTALKAEGAVKFYTATNDGSELRYAFNMGGASDGAYAYLYKADATTIGVSIDAGGPTYFNGGYVGIGINAPTAKLSIEGFDSATSLGTTVDVLIEGGGAVNRLAQLGLGWTGHSAAVLPPVVLAAITTNDANHTYADFIIANRETTGGTVAPVEHMRV
jgi:hypothetical protein